jgi:membrane protein YqaA with SNARE-associated domain
MFGSLEEWTETTFLPLGGSGLFLVAFFSSTFLIVPPDVILILLCLNAVGDPICLWYAVVCTIGSVLGGVFGYYLGITRGRSFMEVFVSRQTISIVESTYERYGSWAVGIAGFTPVPYNIFTVGSGVMKFDLRKFTLMSIFSRGARFLIVAVVIMVWGKTLSDIIDERLLIALTLIIGFVTTIWYFHKERKVQAVDGM